MPINYINPRVLKKFRGKNCLLRVDLNVEPGEKRDSFRLESVLPTMRLLLKSGVRPVILSHYGRPKGRDKNLSLRPFVPVLRKKLKKKVGFISALPRGAAPGKEKEEVLLLENLRFFEGEMKNDAKFAKKLAALGEFYVNDAFAVSHRKNASVVAITRHLPSYGGLLLKKEIENLGGILKYTTRPFVIVIGGAKVGDKLGIMMNLWKKADYFLLGSGPATTFFAAEGLPAGDSFIDRGSVPKIKKFVGSDKLILPVDVKVRNRKILDIGPATSEKYGDLVRKARTVVWNGPVGRFEERGFEEGTKRMWRAVFNNKKARVVVGGGETLASLRLLGSRKLGARSPNAYSLVPNNLFLSTGGGAMLEYLSGEKLPGIEALKR